MLSVSWLSGVVKQACIIVILSFPTVVFMGGLCVHKTQKEATLYSSQGVQSWWSSTLQADNTSLDMSYRAITSLLKDQPVGLRSPSCTQPGTAGGQKAASCQVEQSCGGKYSWTLKNPSIKSLWWLLIRYYYIGYLLAFFFFSFPSSRNKLHT